MKTGGADDQGRDAAPASSGEAAHDVGETADDSLPDPPADPAGTLQPEGCADPTFTGTSFDLVSVAMHGVRLAISTLGEGRPGAYPSADWDVAVIAFRDAEGRLIPPTVQTFPLRRHQRCPVCNARP
ncbi:MAG TPA: hypothetical protein VGD77_06610 [Gemmatimonadaceae bacterium]